MKITKKPLIALVAMFVVTNLHAQIFVTGIMADPRFHDAKGDGGVSQSVYHYGGFEYIQLKATEDIDFSINNYAIIIARNDASNPVTENGWAEGGNVTFKFNLTSGTVNEGDYFYVGGIEKRIAGYKNGTKSTDISETAPIESNRAKWIRAKNVTLGGDDGMGAAPDLTKGLMDPLKPYGIGVFNTKNVLSTTKPIDAIFFAPDSTSIASIQYNPVGAKGYLIPDNDFYDSNQSAYFFQDGKNTGYLSPEQVAVSTWNSINDSNYSWFCKLGGSYDNATETWTEPRTTTYDRLMLKGDTSVDNSHKTIPLSRIEDNSPLNLPVQITSIENLNAGNSEINSHSGWLSSRSSLMMDFRSYVEISTETAVSAPVYPRVRKMANGEYIMFYQNNQIGADTYYVISSDLKTWTGGDRLFARHPIVDQTGANNERRFSTANALVLANGDIIVVASYRANSNYTSLPLDNGIIMRKSTDNGSTWSAPVEIYQGTNWEPHLLQLPSGEIHCYFTDSRTHIGTDNTGTALIVSENNGQSWSPSFGNEPNRVIRQKFKEENGISLYTDQMPGVIKLNNSNELAAVLESRNPSSSIYNLSLAYSGSDGEWTNLTVNQEGPNDRQDYVFPGAGPSIVQFRSGETLMSYNTGGLYHMRLGNATARTFGEPYTPFTKTGFWGTLEMIDTHQVIGSMHTAGAIMLSRFNLNHAIRTTHRSVVVDGNNSEWADTDAALFVGQKSQAQATLRCSADAANIYLLVEVFDYNISYGDYVDIFLTPSGGNGQVNSDSRRIRVSHSGLVGTDKYTGTWSSVNMGVLASSTYDGTISNNSDNDNGYLIEIAIPKTQFDLSSGQLLANFSLYDTEAATEDAIISTSTLSTTNWIPVFLGLVSSHAQAIITGVMADPRWINAKTAPASGEGVVSQGVRHYGGFEYIQLRATEDIDFSVTPYSVVIARNDAANRVTDKGWAEGGNSTFKFNLTSGTVGKGDYFYVGGLEKRIAGYKNGRKSTDIGESAPIPSNRAQWIRAKNVSLGGDDGLGLKPRDTIGLMDPENPYGIAVFSTTHVMSATKPIDAVFFIPDSASLAYVQYDANGNKGYRVPTNDLYDSTDATYFYQNGKNTGYLEPEQVSVPKNAVSKAQLYDQTTWDSTNDAKYSWFGKLGGTYDSVSHGWTVPRNVVYDRLMLFGTTENSHESLTLSRIESDSSTTFDSFLGSSSKIATFPIELNSFTAYNNNYGNILKWKTISETDNSQYYILRTFSKGEEFEVIAAIRGKGASTSENNYHFRDQEPYNGLNYYRVKLVSKNGEISYSTIVHVDVNKDRAELKVFNDKEIIEFSIYSLYGGSSEIRLWSIIGNRLKKESLQLKKGFNTVRWINQFPTGFYVVNVTTSRELMSKKIVIK